MINFTRAFDTAWERMTIILFRPLDLGKWFVIALSAFLAALPAGGNGDDFSPSIPSDFHSKTASFSTNASSQQISTELSHLIGAFSTGFIVLVFVLLFIFIIGLSILLYWLGSRGQFILLDNIVRNRGAVSVPWAFYAPRANRVFLFYLATMLVGLAFMVLLVVPFSLILAFSVHGHDWPGTVPTVALVLLAVLYLLTLIAFFLALFLFREWTIPLIFRNGWDVKTAILETWRLIRANAGSTTIFILLRIALFVAMIVISNIMCLLTCCCGERLPYVGTVLLLPAVIYLRCFSLDVLAQFGPQYDVFTVDLPPDQSGITAHPTAPSPLPPPG